MKSKNKRKKKSCSSHYICAENLVFQVRFIDLLGVYMNALRCSSHAIYVHLSYAVLFCFQKYPVTCLGCRKLHHNITVG